MKLFGQAKFVFGQVIIIVTCPNGQVGKKVNVEPCIPEECDTATDIPKVCDIHNVPEVCDIDIDIDIPEVCDIHNDEPEVCDFHTNISEACDIGVGVPEV